MPLYFTFVKDIKDGQMRMVEIDRHLRIGGKEFRQQGRVVQHAEGDGCGQPHQPARHRCLRQCGVLDCFALGEDVRGASRRDVRLMSRASSRASILLTAFETVALESLSSAAAPAKERSSTTLA